MNNLIEMFNFEDNEVIAFSDNKGEVWFCAKHICNCLGLENSSQALEVLDEDEKTKLENLDISDGIYNIYTAKNVLQTRSSFITEPGLYKLIFKSRKSNAKKFQNWITKKVLPKLRKEGAYAIDPEKQELLDNFNDPFVQLALLKMRERKMREEDEAQKRLLSQFGFATPKEMEGMTAFKAAKMFLTTNAGRHGDECNKGVLGGRRMKQIVWEEVPSAELEESTKAWGKIADLIRAIRQKLVEEDLGTIESVPSEQTIRNEIYNRINGKKPPNSLSIVH